MNRVFSYVMTAILSVAVTLAGERVVRASKTPADSVPQLTNAAFRDGRYMAKLDLESGRRPHLSIGRWNSDPDRAAYLAGYQQAFPLAADRGHGQSDSLRFHLAENENYRSSAGCASTGNQ